MKKQILKLTVMVVCVIGTVFYFNGDTRAKSSYIEAVVDIEYIGRNDKLLVKQYQKIYQKELAMQKEKNKREIAIDELDRQYAANPDPKIQEQLLKLTTDYTMWLKKAMRDIDNEKTYIAEDYGKLLTNVIRKYCELHSIVKVTKKSAVLYYNPQIDITQEIAVLMRKEYENLVEER